MLDIIRAGIAAALFILVPTLAAMPAAAEKAFQRDDLNDAAIKLEAKIKSDAGPVAKPAAALRLAADQAFKRNDFRTGLQILGQILVVAPNDAANWLRLAKAVTLIKPSNDAERAALLDRAATAAYIAYQRTTSPAEEADSLLLMAKSFADRNMWRGALDAMRLSLELREVADVRAQNERMRADHGFRLVDYSVDADAASPRACFQFSEDLPGRRTDFSPFVTVAGEDKPALSVDERQICVEGLKHGERYSITLRAGIPSTVKETLQESAEFTIYVRDRKPFVRFADKSYVLPRTGQRGIPIVSVNTSEVAIWVYRIGDRNLLSTVVEGNFQTDLYPSEFEHLVEEQGVQVRKGSMKVDSTLNADITTAFPVSEAIGTLAPGVYVMRAAPSGTTNDDDAQSATQWFIVSDLGLTAFSGNDGVHVFVNSLETAQGRGQVEIRLVARNNEVLATKRTNDSGYVQFEAALTRGEGGQSPAMIVASDPKGDYAFLSLKSPAFDLSDRGVSGRTVPAGLDAFVYTERGVYRSGETVQVTALLRDGAASAALGVPLTLVVNRPDGVEYRRSVVADQGVGGHVLAVPLVASAPSGTWRVRAFTDPKRPPVGEASFMVEDYVPDRLEFDLATVAKSIAKNSPANVTVDGHYLYGAPTAGLALEGEIVIAPVEERAGFPGYKFGLADEDAVEATRAPLDDLPDTDANGRARFQVPLDKEPSTTHPLEAEIIVRMAEAGGRAVERKLTLPMAPASAMIGVKPLFSGRSLGEGQTATFDVVVAAPDGKPLARTGLHYELVKLETKYQWYRRDNLWSFEPVKLTKRVADGSLDVAADRPARIALPVQWGRYRLEVSDPRPGHIRGLRCRVVRGRQRRHARHAGDRRRQGRVRAGRNHDGCGDGAGCRQAHPERDRRSPAHHDRAGCCSRHGARARTGRQ